MTMTEKENILKYYRHEAADHYPDLRYLYTLHPAKGFLERPVDADGMTEDWFGVKYVYESKGGASLPDPHLPPVVTDLEKWREQIKFPDLDNWDWEKAVELDKVNEIDRENNALSVLIQCGIWERCHSLLGMQEALEALITDEDLMGELISAVAEYKLKLFTYIIKYYKPDIIRQHDDWGTQKSMQMSPKLWRKLIKPHVARLAELCHQNGVAYEQHSCGLIQEIVPDFVEIGIDSWQGMHINDVPKLKQITNGKLNYHMALDAQKYLAMDGEGKLTEEILRKEVHNTVQMCAEGGSYFAVFTALDPTWWGTGIVWDEIFKTAVQVSVS